MTGISGFIPFRFDEGLDATGWKNSLMRWFLPGYASAQDKKISQYFIDFFKNSFSDALETPVLKQNVPVRLESNPEKLYEMITSAEEHLARGQRGCSRSVSKDRARLEVYILAARDRMHIFEPSHPREALLEKCRADNALLYESWKNLEFDEETFWTSPDLVDFLFKTHLHRYITHSYYKHTIDVRPCLLRRNGQCVVSKQPHLLVNGVSTPWPELRNRFHVGKEDRIYTVENGVRKCWTYLEEGLTQYDRGHFESPRPLRRLPHTALRNQVEIVTTRAHRETWRIGDGFLKGFRHSFFRVMPGEGFSNRYPKTGLASGAVYSIGWAPRRQDLTSWAPFSSTAGTWHAPDGWEFFREDLYITPIEVSDEQLLKLLGAIKRYRQNNLPFHFVNANCCTAVVSVFNEAGILNHSPKEHMAYMWYQFLLPKCARKWIEKVASFASQWIPVCIIKRVETFGKCIYSIVWAPIFTLLGAWRAHLPDEEGEGVAVRTRNRMRALFSNVFDMFNSNKMVFDLTKNLYKWQKKQPGTYIKRQR